MTFDLHEPTHVDEPDKAEEYADVLSRVATDRHAVIVRRDGADLAAVVPLEYLELLREAMARERAQQLARKLEWDRLVPASPPPQGWFNGDEPKPF